MSGSIIIGVQALNNNTIGRHNMALGGMALSGGTPRSAEEVLIDQALRDLLRAARDLVAHIKSTSSPYLRPRRFDICSGIYWPSVGRGINLYVVIINDDGHALPVALHSASSNIMRRCQTPRDVIVAIRRIQAATAWCEARVDGLERYNQQEVR